MNTLSSRRLRFELVRRSGFKEWPPRLPEQPIFYPVTNEAYATEIARDWNERAAQGPLRGLWSPAHVER